MKKILLFLMLFNILLGNKVKLIEKEGKFYKEGKLFTGVKVDEERKKTASNFEYSDTIYTYEEGTLVKRKKVVYEERMMGLTNEFLVDQVTAIYNWDYKKKIIYYQKFLDGLLVNEGAYDFTYRKIGVWKEYIEGELLASTFDYDMYNIYIDSKEEGNYTINQKEWDKFDKNIKYKKFIKYFNENEEEFEPASDFDFITFNGKMRIFLGDNLINEYIYQNGFVIENRSFYLNGRIKTEIVVKKIGIGPFKKWKGFQREFFINGNIKEEVTVTYKTVFNTPLDKLSNSFNPSNMNSTSVGIVEGVSYSGPFRQYYSNGQLAVEGEDYRKSQDIRKLKVYNREGKRIFH